MPVTRNQSAFSQGKSSLGTSETAAPEASEPNEEGASAEASRRDSPDNCSICLGPFDNKSFTSSCAHSFCFSCLKQWSKVKAECPLCKQPFTSIFHNVRSNESYDIFDLPLRNLPRSTEYNLYNVGENLNVMTVAAPSATHFQHYLSLSHPSLDADLTLSNFSRFQFRHRRYMGQNHHHHSHHPVHGEHQYSYTGMPVNLSNVSGDTWPRGPEDFRREVYRRRMGPPVVVLGMENSTYRLTPAMVAASSHRIHRIMPWLTRELRVLLHSHQNLRLAISVIQPLLTQLSLDSADFLSRITPLLGRRSHQFVQQFVAYANSALTMQAFDRKAMYQRPDASVLPESSSGSSSSEDDVVEITSVSPASNNNTSSNNREGRGAAISVPRSAPATAMPSSSSVSRFLSSHGWDSPIPGPSWEPLNVVDDDDDVQIQEDPVSVSSETDDPVYRPDARDPDSDGSRAGSDLVFLKYDKPWNERSPINLSSSSDAEDYSKRKKKSKHKKRTKDSESKSHKPSLKIKIRRKHKARKSKDNDEDDYEVGTDSSDEDDRRRSQSIGSGDKSSGKRHKKSRDRSKKSSRRDRELVDRLFAEAIAQPNLTSILQDEPTTATLQTDTILSKQSSSKGKEKRKKKRRGSSSPSTSRPYKKHHSGHKKSSDPSRASQMSSILQGHTPHEAGTSGHSSQADNSATAMGMNISTSLQRPGAFQPPFLAMPDTVQHIPLNLWVSTWPPLSVSTHAFGSAPPTSTAVPPQLPHALNLSASRASGGFGSHTISSSSSTDNASDEGNVAPRSNSSTIAGSHKRTKKWVESNFFHSQVNTAAEKTTAASSSSTNPSSVQAAKPPTTVSSEQHPKMTSFSTDFLLNLSKGNPLTSETANAATCVNSDAKETIELVCSSDDDQNDKNDEVLVCSSDNNEGSDTGSSDDDDNRRHIAKKGKKKRKLKASSPDKSTSASKVNTATYPNSSTLNSDQTSSRQIAYNKQVHSKIQAPALFPFSSEASTSHQNDSEEQALGNILDFLLDCGPSNLPSVSISNFQAGKLNTFKDNHKNILSEPVVTTSVTSSRLQDAPTTSAIAKSIDVITTEAQSLVTSAPFYIFPNTSSQSSNPSISSAHTEERNYIPFPPLLPHAGPLGLPEVPHALPNAFPFQPMAPLIPPRPEIYQLHTQSQTLSAANTPACLLQENTGTAASDTVPQANSDQVQTRNQVFAPQTLHEETIGSVNTGTLEMHRPENTFANQAGSGTSSHNHEQATDSGKDFSSALTSVQKISETISSFSEVQAEKRNCILQPNPATNHDQMTPSITLSPATEETMINPLLCVPPTKPDVAKDVTPSSIQSDTLGEMAQFPEAEASRMSIVVTEKACEDTMSKEDERKFDEANETPHVESEFAPGDYSEYSNTADSEGITSIANPERISNIEDGERI